MPITWPMPFSRLETSLEVDFKNPDPFHIRNNKSNVVTCLNPDRNSGKLRSKLK